MVRKLFDQFAPKRAGMAARQSNTKGEDTSGGLNDATKGEENMDCEEEEDMDCGEEEDDTSNDNDGGMSFDEEEGMNDAIAPIDEYLAEDRIDVGNGGRNDPPERDVPLDADKEDTHLTLKTLVENASEKLLLMLTNACISKKDDSEILRELTYLDDDLASAALRIWQMQKSSHTNVFVCNGCGATKRKDEQCCGDIAKFVRIGCKSQLISLISSHLPSILKLRQGLMKGESTHNLSSPFFSQFWKSEDFTNNKLNLSLLLSIDGVVVSGNKNKLWPITYELLDLPTGEMQKSCNIILEGILECKSTPTTACWNGVLPYILSDVSNCQMQLGEFEFVTKIVSVSADQPAKRALFGMKGHNSPFSCFFCLSPGTFYKADGLDRRSSRGFDQTNTDSKNHDNGFGPVSGIINAILAVYNTPVDCLHNIAEGLIAVILRELLPQHGNNPVAPKSDIFLCDSRKLKLDLSIPVIPSSLGRIHQRRNGTDQLNFFRLQLCLTAMTSNSMSAKSKIVIVALSMLSNQLFTLRSGSRVFHEQMTSAARWFLKEASVNYLSMKAHEVLYHLPFVNDYLGNTAALSTFSFESAYKYILVGYSNSLTTNFCETAATRYHNNSSKVNFSSSFRVLLHNVLRREVAHRAEHAPSARLTTFLSHTHGLVPRKLRCRNVIQKLLEEDTFAELNGYEFYSQLLLPYGTLSSEYYRNDTKDDVFFGEDRGSVRCFRFICALMNRTVTEILAEPVQELPASERYASFLESVESLTDATDLYYGKEVHKELLNYDGIVNGVWSGERVVLKTSAIKGLACYTVCGDSIIALQTGGALIHN